MTDQEAKAEADKREMKKEKGYYCNSCDIFIPYDLSRLSVRLGYKQSLSGSFTYHVTCLSYVITVESILTELQNR